MESWIQEKFRELSSEIRIGRSPSSLWFSNQVWRLNALLLAHKNYIGLQSISHNISSQSHCLSLPISIMRASACIFPSSWVSVFNTKWSSTTVSLMGMQELAYSHTQIVWSKSNRRRTHFPKSLCRQIDRVETLDSGQLWSSTPQI